MPPSQAFQRLSEEHRQVRSARAGDKREAREGDDGNERRERATGDEMELTYYRIRCYRLTRIFHPVAGGIRPKHPFRWDSFSVPQAQQFENQRSRDTFLHCQMNHVCTSIFG